MFVGPRTKKFNILSVDLDPEIPFSGKFGAKSQKCHVKLKFNN